MAFKSNIVSKIKKLERDELDSVTKIKSELKKKNISATHERIEFCRNCLLIDKDSSKQLFNSGENANWSNTIDKLVVAKQLLHKNHLIVDLKPNLKNNDDFVNEYGLTVQQILTLVRRKTIVINLHGYESNRGINFDEYTYFDGNKIEKHAYESLFIQENNMRINSIRRKIVFDHLSSERNASYSETILSAKDTIQRIISSQEIVDVLNKKGIVRAENINGTIQQLTHQYAEVKTILTVEKDKNGQYLLAEIENGDSHYLKMIAMLRVLRIALTSPFSASLGGDYSMSNYESNSMNLANYYLTGNSLNAINSLTFKDQKHPLSIVINNFIQTTNTKRFKLNEVPTFIDDSSFNDYLLYLDEHKSLINLQSQCIKQFVKEKNEFYLDEKLEEKLKILDVYLNSQKDLSKSYEQLVNNWTLGLKITIGSVLALIAPDIVDPKSIESLAYTNGTEVVKELLSPFLAKLFRSYKYQVFLDSESIKKFTIK